MHQPALTDVINIIGPVLLLLGLGTILRRRNVVDQSFIDVASELVFSLCLPALLFTNIVHRPIAESGSEPLVVLVALATFATFALGWVASLLVTPQRDQRGVVAQAAYRGNVGVIGLSLCAVSYGEQGLAIASVLVAVMTFLFNVQSVFLLSWYSYGRRDLKQLLLVISRNPLVLASLLALGVSSTGLSIPNVVIQTTEHLGQMALPLALIGVGASLDWSALKSGSFIGSYVVLLKTLVFPLLVTSVGFLMGLPEIELGILFFLFVAPTGSASHAMVKSMGGDDVLAANLVSLTTLASLVTTIVGLFAIKSLF